MKKQVIKISAKGKQNLVKIHKRNPMLRFTRYGYGVYINGTFDDDEITDILNDLRNKTHLPLRTVNASAEAVDLDFGDPDSVLVIERNEPVVENDDDDDNDPYGFDEQAKWEQWYYSVGRNL